MTTNRCFAIKPTSLLLTIVVAVQLCHGPVEEQQPVRVQGGKSPATVRGSHYLWISFRAVLRRRETDG